MLLYIYRNAIKLQKTGDKNKAVKKWKKAERKAHDKSVEETCKFKQMFKLLAKVSQPKVKVVHAGRCHRRF